MRVKDDPIHNITSVYGVSWANPQIYEIFRITVSLNVWEPRYNNDDIIRMLRNNLKRTIYEFNR